MDFLTGMAYWGILVLVVANAIVVSRMKVRVRDDADQQDANQPDANQRDNGAS